MGHMPHDTDIWYNALHLLHLLANALQIHNYPYYIYLRPGGLILVLGLCTDMRWYYMVPDSTDTGCPPGGLLLGPVG